VAGDASSGYASVNAQVADEGATSDDRAADHSWESGFRCPPDGFSAGVGGDPTVSSSASVTGLVILTTWFADPLVRFASAPVLSK